MDLIVDELKGHQIFYPIVIAANREALKPLAHKVAEGIINAKVIVPILTAKSITTQWINQEIGFSTALSKTILPIVESTLIDSLKGFIHKQIDLPYNYIPNANKSAENKNFIKQIRNLIADLERDFQNFVTAEQLPEKSDFEKSLDQADKANNELQFLKEKKAFLNSVEAVEAARTEVLNMFSEIENKNKKLLEKKFHFGFEKEIYHPSFILKGEGFSFSIAWQQQYNNSNEGAMLYVRQWKGHLTKNSNAFYFHGEEPKILSDNKYVFDRNRENENCWLNQADGKQYKSNQIIDSCLKWLIEEVAKERLDKNQG